MLKFLKSLLFSDPYSDAYIPPRPLSVPADMTDSERADLSVIHRQWLDDNKATARSLDVGARDTLPGHYRPPAYCVEWTPEGQQPQHRISMNSFAHAIQQGIDSPVVITVRGREVTITPMTAAERAALSDVHRAFLDARKAVCMMNTARTHYTVKWRASKPADSENPWNDWIVFWSEESYADAIQRAIDAQPKQYDPRTPQLLALAHRVARLNSPDPVARQLVDEAVNALAGDK